MAFSPLPTNYEDALKEIKMWRAQHTKRVAEAVAANPTQKVQRKPLSVTRIKELSVGMAFESVKFARTIEAEHGIVEKP